MSLRRSSRTSSPTTTTPTLPDSSPHPSSHNQPPSPPPPLHLQTQQSQTTTPSTNGTLPTTNSQLNSSSGGDRQKWSRSPKNIHHPTSVVLPQQKQSGLTNIQSPSYELRTYNTFNTFDEISLSTYKSPRSKSPNNNSNGSNSAAANQQQQLSPSSPLAYRRGSKGSIRSSSEEGGAQQQVVIGRNNSWGNNCNGGDSSNSQRNRRFTKQTNQVSPSSPSRHPRHVNKSGSSADPTACNPPLIAGLAMDKRRLITVIVLFVVNLLNYMDRYTVAGVLTEIQAYYGINDTWGGLLQTVFIILFLICAPVAGFLGDRYNRKWIMVVGLSVWVGAVIASSFVPPQAFWLFVALRGVVGIGEASYSTIAPTILADLFVGPLRSRVLMLFYFAIPMGAGLGYVCGSFVASTLQDWRWGIRVTPLLGALSIITLATLVEEPERGQADGEQLVTEEEEETDTIARAGDEEHRAGLGEEEEGARQEEQHRYLPAIPEHPPIVVNEMDGASTKVENSYVEDLRYLMKIPTYLYSIIGYTAVVFVTGTFAWWAPAAINHAQAWKAGLNSTTLLPKEERDEVALVFGGITVLSGFTGVALGTLWSHAWKQGNWCFGGCRSRRADPLISAIGSFVAVPLLFAGFYLMGEPIPLLPAWLAVFLAIAALCLNWAINVDMLMDIVVPARRSTANSWLIMASHLFGDASGPWIVGALSDMLRAGDDTPAAHFHSLAHAFYVPNLMLLVSGIAFLWCARTLGGDMLRFKIEMERLRRLRCAAASNNHRNGGVNGGSSSATPGDDVVDRRQEEVGGLRGTVHRPSPPPDPSHHHQQQQKSAVGQDPTATSATNPTRMAAAAGGGVENQGFSSG